MRKNFCAYCGEEFAVTEIGERKPNCDCKKEHRNQANAKYRKNNPVDYKASHKKYEQSFKGKVAYYRICQKLRMGYLDKSLDTLTGEELEGLYVSQAGKCACCHADITGYWEIDHKLPVAKGGHLCLENIQILCKDCNKSKMIHDIDFLKYQEINGTCYMDDLKTMASKSKIFNITIQPA